VEARDPPSHSTRVGRPLITVSTNLLHFFVCQLSYATEATLLRMNTIKIRCSILVLAALLLVPAIYPPVAKYIEFSFVKGKFVHNLVNHLGRRTILRKEQKETDDDSITIVAWIHISRTASDAMQTHLFDDLDYENSGPFPTDFREFLSKRAALGDAPVDSASTSSTGSKEHQHVVFIVKGFFCRRDLDDLL
jgi:hypothetical protein